MSLLIGAACGLLAGLGVHCLANHYVSRDPRSSGPASTIPFTDRPLHETGPKPPGVLRSTTGAARLVEIIPLAGMSAWGAYVSWWTTDLAVVLATLVVTGLLLVISVIDLAVRRIPNPLVLALLAWAILPGPWFGGPSVLQALLGLLVGGGLFSILALLHRGALGAGDVKLAAALGALVGLHLVVPALLYGTLAGAVAALFLLITRRAGRRDYMAYGPYLALGAWLVWTRSLGLWPG